MAMTVSGPRALLRGSSSDNASKLLQLIDSQRGPSIIRHARSSAGAAEWLHLGAMLLAESEYATAYDAYVRASSLDPTQSAALDGLVKTAVAAHHEDQALGILKSLRQTHSRIPAIWVATSKLLPASGATEQAIASAREACDIEALEPPALEQLASIFADLSHAARLAPVAEELPELQPHRAPT